MKFNAKELRQLTFPKGTRGYKKKDVDDFLLFVSKDYYAYDRQISAQTEKIEKLNDQILQLRHSLKDKERLLQQKDTLLVQQQKQENPVVKSVRTVYGETTHEYPLAQQIALEIEQAAEKECLEKRLEAEKYYTQQVNANEEQRKEMAIERQRLLEQIQRFENELMPLVEQTKQVCITATTALENGMD